MNHRDLIDGIWNQSEGMLHGSGEVEFSEWSACATITAQEGSFGSFNSQHSSGSFESVVTMESIKLSCVKAMFPCTLPACHSIGRMSLFQTCLIQGIRGWKYGEMYRIMCAIQLNLHRLNRDGFECAGLVCGKKGIKAFGEREL